mgnify:CR=1 FL=1
MVAEGFGFLNLSGNVEAGGEEEQPLEHTLGRWGVVEVFLHVERLHLDFFVQVSGRPLLDDGFGMTELITGGVHG